MDGLDRPTALFCERRAIPTEKSNYLKNIRFVESGGAIGAQPGVTGVSGFPRYGHRIAIKS
jgi:hypothetical protein